MDYSKEGTPGNDSRVRGDTQGQSDDPTIPALEQAGINDDQDIKGCEDAVNSTRDEDEYRDQDEIEEKLDLIGQVGPVAVLPQQHVKD